MNPVIQSLSNRRSIREYEKRAIEPEKIEALINAAFCAPSARNAQPWHLTVIQDQSVIDELSKEGIEALAKGNMPTKYVHLFHGAPCLITIANDTQSEWSQIDSGIMAQTIAVAAESLGLGSCIIGLIKGLFRSDINPDCLEAEEKYYKKFGVPENYRIGLAVAVGYAAQAPDARPKERKLTRV